MKKKMFVKKGYQFILVDLIIDVTDIFFFKNLIDYYPIWDDIAKNGRNVCSVEEYAKESNFVVERDTWVISKLFEKILYEENPLVISDAMKKIYEYVPKNEREKIFLEEIFNRLSYKIPRVEIKTNNNLMNTVAYFNYVDVGTYFEDVVDEMIANERDCIPELSDKKEKRLRLNIKNSIPRKNILF